MVYDLEADKNCQQIGLEDRGEERSRMAFRFGVVLPAGGAAMFSDREN